VHIHDQERQELRIMGGREFKNIRENFGAEYYEDTDQKGKFDNNNRGGSMQGATARSLKGEKIPRHMRRGEPLTHLS